MSHITHKQAENALCDPEVPAEDAVKLFERAFHRSNDATKGFVLHWCGLVRAHRCDTAMTRERDDAIF